MRKKPKMREREYQCVGPSVSPQPSVGGALISISDGFIGKQPIFLLISVTKVDQLEVVSLVQVK